jgi:tubulin--tyrosine ligase
MIHFQTLPNAFELFGVDFLVDANGDVWLLELNAYPLTRHRADLPKDLLLPVCTETGDVMVEVPEAAHTGCGPGYDDSFPDSA